MNVNKLSHIQIDVLREIGNMGAGNAASSMAALSVDMAGAVLTVGLIEVSQVIDYVIVINTRIKHDAHR